MNDLEGFRICLKDLCPDTSDEAINCLGNLKTGYIIDSPSSSDSVIQDYK